MLFSRDVWPRLADGSVTVAFRRWRRPSVKAGGSLHSPVGLLAIDEVERIAPGDVTEDDARAAGYTGREEALASLRPEGHLYRIRFHRVSDDPRVELRSRTDFSEEELQDLLAAVRRLTWAAPVLELIATHPGVVSTELAPQVGMERLPFKQRVRRLKALGLTESLKVGYRLSPRGEALRARLTAPAPAPPSG